MYLQCAICREAYFLSASARSRHQQMCLALNDYFTSAVASNNDNRRETHEAAIQTPPQQIKAVPSGSGLKRKLPPPKVTKRPVTSVLSSPSSHTSSTTRLTWYLKKGLQSAKDYVIENNENLYKDLPPFIEAANEVVLDILQDELRVTKSLKYNVVLEAVYCHPEGHCELMNFKTTSRLIHSACDELQELLKKDASKLLREESEAQAKGSGWTLHEVKSLTLRLSKFSYALPAGSGYLPLPPKIAKRKCILNVKNSNDCCFMYCILAKSLPNIRYDSVLTEHSFRECETHYNFDGISFPTPISQMKKFEKQNINTSVNIFELDENAHITPLRIVDEQQDHFDLLLVRNDEGEAHFTLILNFTKLMQPQITKGSNKITICKRCSTFKENRRCVPTPQHWLSEHLMLCGKSKPSEVILPEQHKSKLRFVSYEMQIEVPIVVTADFESTLYPVPSTDNAYQRHEANSFAYIVASNLPKELLEEAEINTSPYIHRSESAAKEFLLQMQELAVKVEKLYTKNVSMIALNDEQQKQHDEATNCELCEIAFDETLVQSRKCRDHDHITDSPYGLLLECDVTVPEHLHDLMNDFPILPEQKDVDNQGKLLATLEDKKHYIAHYTVFQQAVKLGLKITKVHRALRFSQSPWMEKFIDKNTTLRAESTNEFSKNFYKFMNNSVFGKTLENVRNRVDIRIVTSDEAFQKLSRQARFVDRSIIADGVIAERLGDVLDRSCYPKEHELWLEGAIPQIGTFKDECKGRQLFEYVGLRCKMYCYRFNSSQQTTAKKKCKGISKRYVENKISFDHYKKALFEDKQYRATFNQIRSKTFQLTSRTVDKLSLSANDNKRIVLQDKIRTLAYGHYRARQNDDGGSSEYDCSQS
ncbi:uncharacterized protein LOC128991718 [Macrosteles quadrilineatus]|uniref:uncharacterized protein LOC128991718 n=1 Tax=Macrosteles quadrilineatus TaxID=74068 RepID=UPI0023E15D1A|nr:uncharacterized protein LOC128991718 [Macrosteles quadrilineatus]